MWLKFALAVVVASLLLYGPGYLFFRALRLSRILALSCAPLFGVFMYSALPVVYYKLGIGCSVVTVVLPALLIAACAWFIAQRRGGLAKPRFALGDQGTVAIAGRRVRFDVAVPAAYVVAATIVCLWVFVSSLPQATAFFPRYDNQTHLNLIRTFMDSGKWSTLHTSTYLALPEQARAVVGAGGFYPAAWHCLVALVSLATGAEVTLGVNAVVTVVACVLFPLGMYAFMSTLFGRNRLAIALGVFAATGFATWPWLFLVTGPLYPNQLGVSMLFAILALAIVFVNGEHTLATVPRFVVCCAISFVALALSHPSVVFMAYVFMACFGSHVLWLRLCSGSLRSLPPNRRALQIGLLAAYWVAIVGFWMLCFLVPQLKEVTSYQAGSSSSMLRVLGSAIMLKFGLLPLAQVGMSIACVVGCVVCLRSKEYRWFLLPAAYFALASVLAYSNDSSPLAHWLGGFWYTDGRRLSVNMCLFLMPVVAAGMCALFLPTGGYDGEVGRDGAEGRADKVGRANVAASRDGAKDWANAKGRAYAEGRVDKIDHADEASCRADVEARTNKAGHAKTGTRTNKAGHAKTGIRTNKASRAKEASCRADAIPQSKVARRVTLVGRITLAIILVLVYLPVMRIPIGGERAPISQLLAMRDMVSTCYGGDDERVYSAREVDFVNRAMELMPDDALVINYAPDGSVWAYGVNGLNTMYHSHRIGGQTPEAVAIREHLCEYATNPEVREAVQKMGASYVLLLDKGVSYADGHWVPQFKEKSVASWAGIGGVDDNTPGFVTMLAEDDDMRLYKIES